MPEFGLYCVCGWSWSSYEPHDHEERVNRNRAGQADAAFWQRVDRSIDA